METSHTSQNDRSQPCLSFLTSHLIQGGHVDELPPGTGGMALVRLLHSVWVVLDTVEYVAGHVCTGGVMVKATLILPGMCTEMVHPVCQSLHPSTPCEDRSITTV